MHEENQTSISRLDKFSTESSGPGVGSKKVLIIEDNPILVKLYSMYLRNHYFIDIAYNGLDAVKKALKNPPHLILLDIMMPGLDGFSVAQRLFEAKSNIPVIDLTVKHLNKGEIHLLKSLGINSFFQKDELTQEMLFNEIRKYID